VSPPPPDDADRSHLFGSLGDLFFPLPGTVFGSAEFFTHRSNNPTEIQMNKEHVKGAADKAKGAVEHAAGKVTGNERLREKGNIDKAKGELHKAAGDIKDAAKRAAE
jgi:uncharacterized protein YjbJ (UPF0337 family)